ncbi:adenosylcobinamide-GDP ribazoletransferase [Comamonas serinivorans]|uniref:adenosylcobinamide-GDP ribazoletransferase n=1 Tax=Comamonas serinivorans TaxID=1082851 RepID=UPI00196B6D0C|nr:adenosylcobinamide-GDP ribazoletransferase [Comamonas serinivorans]
MGWLRHELALCCIALQFLTRVPIPRWVGFDAAWLTTCVRHFPLVGALVGAFGAAVLALAAAFWPAWVAATLAVGATAWLTCAFHEDGLADTCDALMGWVPREKALLIMKDSRIGTYGTVGLLVVTGLRIGLLATLAAHDVALACAALVATHMWARASAVLLMVSLPYGGDAEHAKAKPLALDVPAALVLPALGWSALALALPLPGLRLALAAVLLLAWVLWMRAWLRRRLGGFTGDALGATEQGAEALMLLVLAGQAPGWLA